MARALLLATLAGALALAAAWPSAGAGAEPAAPLPERLSDTGLYEPGATATPQAGVLAFTPQYPLWSDGAAKRRWLRLPPGTAIDASNPDAWQFPPGTRLWKEFALAGRAVETRYIERQADGRWRFATYIWDAEGRDATLAAPRGTTLALPAAPDGRYAVPSRGDCFACHGGAPVPVLGVSALQLSPSRDPLAAGVAPPREGDVDLRALVERGLLRGLPPALLATPPRIPAADPLTRAALGYLHGNCAHCHHRAGNQVPLALTLAQRSADPETSLREVLQATLDAGSRYRPPGFGDDAQVVTPGDPAASVLAERMRSRHPQVQMPPLGTRVPDAEGLALVQRWIAGAAPSSTTPAKETLP